jgi:hypothetical protein
LLGVERSLERDSDFGIPDSTPDGFGREEAGFVAVLRVSFAVATDLSEEGMLLAPFGMLLRVTFSLDLVDKTTGPGPKCSQDNVGRVWLCSELCADGLGAEPSPPHSEAMTDSTAFDGEGK